MNKFKLIVTISSVVVIIGSSIYIIVNGILPDEMLMPHALLNLVAGLALSIQILIGDK